MIAGEAIVKSNLPLLKYNANNHTLPVFTRLIDKYEEFIKLKGSREVGKGSFIRGKICIEVNLEEKAKLTFLGLMIYNSKQHLTKLNLLEEG